jgi:hypothetical protein
VSPGFELENRYEIGGVDERLVFSAFLIAKGTFVGALGEPVDLLLDGRSHPLLENPACGFGVKALAQRLQKRVDAEKSAHLFKLPRGSCKLGAA